MSKMSELDLMLNEYRDYLNEFGHNDPMVVTLKRGLLSYNLDFVNEEVECIDYEFDTLVFNNQTEGVF